MRLKVKFNNDDNLNLNSRLWLKVVLLVLGSIFILLASIQIYCVVAKPSWGKVAMEICGDKYISQLIIGLLLIISVVLISRSKSSAK